MHNRFVMRVVVLERLRKGTVGECGCGHSHRITESENTAWTGRRQRHGGITCGFSERRFRARERQPDDVHHSKFSGLDDVGRKIFESDARGPCSQLARKWHVHWTTVQLSIRD